MNTNIHHLDYYTARRARKLVHRREAIKTAILSITLLVIFLTLTALTTEPVELSILLNN